ncbi:MAG: c-type cytochrome [Planctomycetaceae bacterium]|nr:c-type cytochrome [Planctomycetaceae bacterium]
MEVPEGFTVELVASEPDLVNPVAMTIDEQGRFWVCESLEYPRHEPGVGRDRIKVLEDTDRDGKVDKTWVYADGLNIPSGIAVGHGGVWVANAPDILFLRDTDGDGKADEREVVVTGFGRDDTHELPNSLTWGPDGWLYGLNGVFNPAKVTQDGETFDFTCAVFRIHPVTRKFELFAEGTSNPWGIAFDDEGSLFVSACVIDHFWHLAETGYYIRQGGPYPPHTWILPSIVKHTHQMAAYCGLHYCDSDAFPEEWRNVFLMGNIHGNCINADVTERRGSTYFGKPREDFLSANDVWFMTVEQMTGPDGSLYVLDWYDRYHCYQDASADPKGVDRLHGRLYRVRYKETPYLPADFDLAKESDEQLIERLDGGNDFLRATAKRLLAERLLERRPQKEEGPLAYKRLRDDLWDFALHGPSKQARMNALWSLVSAGGVEDFMLMILFDHDNASFRAWGVRALANRGSELRSDQRSRRRPSSHRPMTFAGKPESWNPWSKVWSLAKDPSPDVRLQVATAARHGRPQFGPRGPDGSSENITAIAYFDLLATAGDDPLIPTIVWQNVKGQITLAIATILDHTAALSPADRSPALKEVLVRAAELFLAEKVQPATIARIVNVLAEGDDASSAGQVLRTLADKIATGEIRRDQVGTFRPAFEPIVAASIGKEGPLRHDAALLGATWSDVKAREIAHDIVDDREAETGDRLAAAQALLSGGGDDEVAAFTTLLADKASGSAEFRGGLIAALGRSESPQVADAMLSSYDSLEPELRPRAIELLAQRPAWGERLVAAVEAKQIPKDAVGVNQVRRLVSSNDEALAAKATAIWGTIREGRSPEREKVIAEVRKQLEDTHGDPFAGEKAFAKVCGQCHKIYGNGEEVGPDITRNGRNDFDQLLSNVLDPSLVIGAGYQARTVVTSDGRVLSGLVVEDTPQRLVLKLQGGKTEAIPRDSIEEDVLSPVSLMPEGLERQLSPQEMADLFAFLSLDKPPSDQDAKRLPGAPAGK